MRQLVFLLAVFLLALAPASAWSAVGARSVRPLAPMAITTARVPYVGAAVATEVLASDDEESERRPPYLLTDLPRPEWRGKMMGWLHATRAWYVISALYVLAAWKLPTRVPLGATGLALRLGATLASSANVYISDGYHNGDKRGPDAYTAAAETVWLKWDYIGISSVLTSLLWLWSSNLGWAGQLKAASVAGGVCTALIAAISATVVPKKAGHTAVKLLMAFQFVGLLGYLISLLTSTALKACAFNGYIFWVYAPGLILYVLKKPQNQVFGFHEMFHTSVLAGHVMSMLCDIRDILSPCARGLCGL